MAKIKTAAAYYRTSSVANLDGDSLPRQRRAVRRYAKAAGITIVSEHYDAAVKGGDHVTLRGGFNKMLVQLLSNGCRTILVETASRFARDLIVQLTGHALLKGHGIELIAVDAPDHFLDDTPTAVLIRQILGAVAEFQKSDQVAKLAAGRTRKRRETGRCGGRHALKDTQPELLRQARRLRRASRETGKRMPYAKVSIALSELGFFASTGKPHSPSVVRRLVPR